MKVKELIEILKKHDPEMRVFVDGYEGGVGELTADNVGAWPIAPHTLEEGLFGTHKICYFGEPSEETVVVLER